MVPFILEVALLYPVHSDSMEICSQTQKIIISHIFKVFLDLVKLTYKNFIGMLYHKRMVTLKDSCKDSCSS